jgi:hypothetical protein
MDNDDSKWLSVRAGVEKMSWWQRLADEIVARFSVMSREKRGLITALVTSAVFGLLFGANWLAVSSGTYVTVDVGKEGMGDLMSAVFTAAASFIGITFIVFVLLIERLAGNDYLDRPTFIRFMRKSSTDLLLAASVTLLILTGCLLYTLRLAPEVNTHHIGLSLAAGICLVALAVWIVKVAFIGINFAAPNQIFIDLKHELQNVSDREMKRGERARKANAELNKCILSYEENPASTSPLLQSNVRDAYQLEGGFQVTIPSKAYDRVVSDVNLEKLDYIMRELTGGQSDPPFQVELTLDIGDVVPGSEVGGQVTVAYVKDELFNGVTSWLKGIFRFRPILPLRIEEAINSIETVAVQSIDDNFHQGLTTALEQISDLQSNVTQSRIQEPSLFISDAPSHSPKSRLSDNFRKVLGEIAEAAIQQGNERSISAVMSTWADVIQSATSENDGEVLALYTSELGHWVTLASVQPKKRHERFGDDLVAKWKPLSRQTMSGLQEEARRFEHHVCKEECKTLKTLKEKAVSFQYTLAQGWYVIRESIDEEDFEEAHATWYYGRHTLVGSSMLPMSAMGRELEKIEKALGSEPENQEIKRAKQKLETSIEQLQRLRSGQKFLRLAAVAYGIQKIENGEWGSSLFSNLIEAFDITTDLRCSFAKELRYAIEDADRQDPISRSVVSSGINMSKEMVEAYILCALCSMNPNPTADETKDNVKAIRQLVREIRKPSGVRSAVSLPTRIQEFIANRSDKIGLPDNVLERVEQLENEYDMASSS